ncbi:MAG TPA: septal ring lytic transglycosylase RlpA family protein [Pseudolabrys sp.]|jgi:rare lipoprotein A
MPSPALRFRLNAIRKLSGRYGEALATLFLAAVFLSAMVWDGIESNYAATVDSLRRPEITSGSVVLSFINTGSSAAADSELILLVDFDPGAETCSLDDSTVISPLDLSAGEATTLSDSPGTNGSVVKSVDAFFTDANARATDLVSSARLDLLPNFMTAYRSILRLVTTLGLPRIQEEADLSRTTIIGTVSTYNPYRDGKEEGGVETASGEFYDPTAWTAAIQTGLRKQFGGVRYGRLYQPTYALVTSGPKQVIVKINDVGPLKPGRVLDLNERSMRFFDPFLTHGLIRDVRITLLPGEDWIPGPVGEAYAIDFDAVRRRQTAQSDSEETELATIRARFDHAHSPDVKPGVQAELRPSD